MFKVKHVFVHKSGIAWTVVIIFMLYKFGTAVYIWMYDVFVGMM